MIDTGSHRLGCHPKVYAQLNQGSSIPVPGNESRQAERSLRHRNFVAIAYSWDANYQASSA